MSGGLPKNAWMTSFDFITQAAHASLGANVVMLAIVFSNGSRTATLLAALAFVVLYAAPKEFIYDALYELPAQTSRDNWTDFAFLTLGALLGIGVYFLHVAVGPVIAIVPAWNEAPTIAAVLRALMGPFVGRVLVVDDGSTDDTVREAKRVVGHVVSTPKNLGKGQAMLHALSRISPTEDVAFFDADLIGFKPQHAQSLLDAFSQGYDMVCGLRDWGSLSNAAQLALPLLTGERIFKRAVLDAVPADCWAGYGIETAMNDAVERMRGKTALLFMLGVTIRTKADKDGFVAGNLRHWRMYDAIGEVKKNLRGSGGASCVSCK